MPAKHLHAPRPWSLPCRRQALPPDALPLTTLLPCCRLEVHCSTNLSTPDIETEIFLHVLHNCIEYVQGENDPDPSAAAANVYMEEGDGMARWAAGTAYSCLCSNHRL
jgi:hypothetical protein